MRANQLSFAELAARADELTTKLAPVIPYTLAHDVLRGHERFAYLLHEDPALSVWLLGWRAGEDETEIHDHGASSAYVRILAGTVTEKLWRPYTYKLALTRELPAGSASVIPAPYVHQFIAPRFGAPASLSLHLYSPALMSMKLFRVDGARLTPTGHWLNEAALKRRVAA